MVPVLLPARLPACTDFQRRREAEVLCVGIHQSPGLRNRGRLPRWSAPS